MCRFEEYSSEQSEAGVFTYVDGVMNVVNLRVQISLATAAGRLRRSPLQNLCRSD